jgi:hypothetical protein
LTPGSPVLYYVLMVPVTVLATLAALVVGWRLERVAHASSTNSMSLNVK